MTATITAPGRLGPVGRLVSAGGAAAVVMLVAGRLSVAGTSSGLSRVGMALSVVALLLAPTVWSTATAFAASGGAHYPRPDRRVPRSVTAGLVRLAVSRRRNSAGPWPVV